MKTTYVSTLLSLLALFFPFAASAHQPVIVDNSGAVVEVANPEISKAYYGHLQGKPQVFQITATAPFTLYLNVTVPDIAGAKKDVSAALIDVQHLDKPVAVLDGISSPWTPFHEPFANDDYFKGPEFRAVIPAGTYQVGVWSTHNDSAYSLAIGEAESFSLSDIINAYVTIPQIKSSFFGKPAYFAYFTPFLGGPIVLLLIFLTGLYAWRRRRGTDA